jgi:hypothetical protein
MDITYRKVSNHSWEDKMDHLIKVRENLMIKLDVYSRTDLVAYERVLAELFKIEMEMRDLGRA